jgi:hypothetical protein
MVLAPDHLALTSKTQPALFWYQSQPTQAGFELTLIDPHKPKPLLAVNLEKAENAGIRAVSLKEYGVSLEPGIAYQWTVALVPDPSHRSKDLFATGFIERIAPPAGLPEKLSGLSLPERAALYADASLWYDALQAITAAIANEPKNPELHRLRASLLTQAGLKEAAAADQP